MVVMWLQSWQNVHVPRTWEVDRVDSVESLGGLAWFLSHVVQAALPLSPSSDSIADRMLEGEVCGVLLDRGVRCSWLRTSVMCQCRLFASVMRVARSVCIVTCTQRMPPVVSGGLVVVAVMGGIGGMYVVSAGMCCALQKSVMLDLSVSRVAEGRRKMAVSECVVVSRVISALAVLLCMACWIALVPGSNSCDILCLMICCMRSLFILRMAAPLAMCRVLLAVVMSCCSDARSCRLGVPGRLWWSGPCCEFLRRSSVVCSVAWSSRAVECGSGCRVGVAIGEVGSSVLVCALVCLLSVWRAESSLFSLMTVADLNGFFCFTTCEAVDLFCNVQCSLLGLFEHFIRGPVLSRWEDLESRSDCC